MKSREPAPVTWMLLVYKLPNHPSAARVFVWRKLKKLGALLLHDAVWVLPFTAVTREQLRWLESEIVELGGEATLWESKLVSGETQQALINRFVASVEQQYRQVLVELKRDSVDLAALSRLYQQTAAVDYFGCQLGKRVRSALASVRGGKP